VGSLLPPKEQNHHLIQGRRADQAAKLPDLPSSLFKPLLQQFRHQVVSCSHCALPAAACNAASISGSSVANDRGPAVSIKLALLFTIAHDIAFAKRSGMPIASSSPPSGLRPFCFRDLFFFSMLMVFAFS
jgi:hypothetical protein